MSVTAYVLIQTEVGRSEKVAKAARDIAGVVDADNVAGPYDVIVQGRGRPLDDLGKLVVSEIQKVDGITRTFTCPSSTCSVARSRRARRLACRIAAGPRARCGGRGGRGRGRSAGRGARSTARRTPPRGAGTSRSA